MSAGMPHADMVFGSRGIRYEMVKPMYGNEYFKPVEMSKMWGKSRLERNAFRQKIRSLSGGAGGSAQRMQQGLGSYCVYHKDIHIRTMHTEVLNNIYTTKISDIGGIMGKSKYSITNRSSSGRTAAVSSADEGTRSPSVESVRIPFGNEGREIILETGEIGRQASAAVMARDGDTMLYTTVCADSDGASDGSFAPLQVVYTERFSAAGRTSGSFFKRDSRPKEHEVLVSRLVDRPLRPAISSGWPHSTQVLQWVMSYDFVHSSEPLAITAAGAAMALSEVPMKRAVAGVRVGLIPERGFVVNPTVEEMENSRLDLVMAGTSEAVLMIEGFCDFLTESEMIQAISKGQECISAQCLAIEAWASEVGKHKRTNELLCPPPGLDDIVMNMIGEELKNAYKKIKGKQERGEKVSKLKDSVRKVLIRSENDETENAENITTSGDSTFSQQKFDPVDVSLALKRVESAVMRNLVLKEGHRADGRSVDQVRPIVSRAGLLPRTHGSALFTRGETQALAVTTLGCKQSAQRVDSMASEEDEERRFYLQYFFPPSSVGETGRVGAPGRREVGHGNLAERALAPVVPSEDEFPYTVRVESTITESNGSSSMASVCGGCLAMLDAGVPLRTMIAGVAMGLVLEPDGTFSVLTDILGSEDALGDMDFKVAGDENGITAFQMDIKVEGITLPIMEQALASASAARKHILKEMKEKCNPAPRQVLSPLAPRIGAVNVPEEKIGIVIGPGGRTLRSIEDSCNVEVDIDNKTGEAWIKATSDEALNEARQMIEALALDPVPGKIYRNAKVIQVTSFGAFVEFAPKRDGLLHVSEWSKDRVSNIADVAKEGDLVDVMVLDVVEGTGKVRLSRKAVLAHDEGQVDIIESYSKRGNGSGEVGKILEEDPPTAGKIYRDAKVAQVMSYGAFVELGGKKDGLLHISEWADERTPNIEDVVKQGDKVDVIVLDVAKGKIRLSRKALLAKDNADLDEASKAINLAKEEVSEEVDAPGTPTESREEKKKELKINVINTEK